MLAYSIKWWFFNTCYILFKTITTQNSTYAIWSLWPASESEYSDSELDALWEDSLQLGLQLEKLSADSKDSSKVGMTVFFFLLRAFFAWTFLVIGDFSFFFVGYIFSTDSMSSTTKRNKLQKIFFFFKFYTFGMVTFLIVIA